MNIQDKNQIQIEDYIDIVFRRKWCIIVPFVISIIGVIAILLTTPPKYRSSTLILVEPQKVPESYIRSTVTIDITNRLNTISQQVMSRTRLEAVINEFDLYRDSKDKLTTEEIIENMRRNIEIDVKRKDSFTISYQGKNPETVMHVTNRLASLFIEENLKVREQQAEGTKEFLDSQLLSLKASLEQQEAQIKAFKEKYMGELPSQLDTNLRTLDRLQFDLQATNDSLKAAEDRRIGIERQLSEVSPSINSESGIVNQVAAGDPRRARLVSLYTELSRLSSIYTEKYPDIVHIKSEIKKLENELQAEKSSSKGKEKSANEQIVSKNPLFITLSNQLNEANADIKGLKQRQEKIMTNIAIFQGRVERIPQREQEVASLMRDYENTRANYQNLLNKKLEAQISENLEKRQKGEQFRILDPANLPMKPFKPDHKKIILLGLALGLGGGFGLAYMVEYLDASFRKPEDVYSYLGLPVLATIPKIRMHIR